MVYFERTLTGPACFFRSVSGVIPVSREATLESANGPQGVARGIDSGVDVATNPAKILDRLSTHRSESFKPHNFELLFLWHAGEWVLRTILQGPL